MYTHTHACTYTTELTSPPLLWVDVIYFTDSVLSEHCGWQNWETKPQFKATYAVMFYLVQVSLFKLRQPGVPMVIAEIKNKNSGIIYLWPYRLKWVALILGHNTESDDFWSAGQKCFGFHQNWERQAFFWSKTLLEAVTCDVLCQFQFQIVTAVILLYVK